MSTPISASTRRKRKRDDEKTLLGESFVIQPHSTSLFETSVRLYPAVLLPRYYVPFKWLAGVPSRLFSAQISSLEVPGNVLIAKTDGERQLYAVERISQGAFTLTKFSTTVKLRDVRKIASLARKTKANSIRSEVGRDCLKKNWWAGLMIDRFPENMLVTTKHSLVLSMLKGRKEKSNVLRFTGSAEPLSLATGFREPTPTEVLEQTRAQYYDTLYLAKTSIAYFTKSTLSRARVLFQNPSLESELSPSELINFLQGMLLPLDKMDFKFQKALIQSATEEAAEDETTYMEHEKEYIQRWILTTFGDRVLQSTDTTLKRQVEDLKIRETEMQIILLLEILALKSKFQPEKALAPHTEQRAKCTKRTKAKKKRDKKRTLAACDADLDVVLDLLVDRLCIWRSIGSIADADKPKLGQPKEQEDRLRHFCIEVIMAFYSSRLPEKCAAIQKKCGATIPATADRSPIKKKIKRQLNPITKSPPLYRSAKIQDAVAPTEVKPRVTSIRPSKKSTSVKKTVDINAIAAKKLEKRAIEVPRLNLKPPSPNLEEELKNAIMTLAKPNRLAAGLQLAEEKSRRLSGSSSASIKKRKKTVQSRLPNINGSVQVMGTPSKSNGPKSMILPTPQIAEDCSDDHNRDKTDRLLLPPLKPRHTRISTSSSSDCCDPAMTPNLFPKIAVADIVPESSPIQAPSLTPKRPSTFELASHLPNNLIGADVMIESSPIKCGSREHPGASSLAFPPRPTPITKLSENSLLRTASTPTPYSTFAPSTANTLICETPTKRRRVRDKLDLYEDSNVFSTPYAGQPSGGVSLDPIEVGNRRSERSAGTLKYFRSQSSANGTGASNTGKAQGENFYIRENPVKAKKKDRQISMIEAFRPKSRLNALNNVGLESVCSLPSSQLPLPASLSSKQPSIPNMEVNIYECLGWDEDLLA